MSFDFDYYPHLKRPPRARVMLVVGPPASGKSTYVESRMKPGDIILDLDAIRSEITGKPLYSLHSRSVTEQAIKIRNKRIEEIQDKAMNGNYLWLILTGGNTNDRMVWKIILTPYRTIVMRCTPDECIRRIKERQSETEYEQIQAVKKWFAGFELLANEYVVDTMK